MVIMLLLLLSSSFGGRLLFSDSGPRRVAMRLTAPTPAVTQAEPEGDGVEFTLQTTGLALGKDGQWQAPALNGRTQQAGAPSLPTYTTLVALPPEATVEVRVEETEVAVAVVRPVRPVPQLVPGGAFEDAAGFATLDEARLEERMDAAVYGQDAFYPAQAYTISEPMYIRDLRVVQLTLYPVRYNPAGGQLYQAGRVEVSLVFRGGQMSDRRPLAGEHSDALASQVINFAQADGWRSLPAGLEAVSPELPLGVDVYKIEVNQDGIYEVDYDDLAAAGMAVNSINPHTFQMMYRGESVAYQFVGDGDNSFETGEKVRFYGWAFDGPRLEKQFVRNNVFWLWANGTPALVTQTSNPTGYPADSSFLSTVTSEPEVWWHSTWTNQWAFFPNEPDAWYWQRIIKNTNPVTNIVNVALPNPASSGGNASWTAEYMSYPSTVVGGIEQPHVVTVDMNDYPAAGVGNWYGKQSVNISGAIPQANVINGNNKFDTVLSSTGTDRVFLNRITVNYQRRYIAQSNQLIFGDEVGGQQQFGIGGYSEGNAANVVVWNIGNRFAPVQVPMAAGNISGSNPYTYTFGSSHTAGTRFIATTAGSALSPLSVSQYIGPELDAAGGAAWVAIAYHEFITETNRLAEHRAETQFGGLTTHVVDVQDVINQYGYGLPIPDAIHDYLQHALLNWPVAPRYAVMVGDATTNPKMIAGSNMGAQDPQLVLTDLPFVDRFQGQIPSDQSFVLLTGNDLLADMAIGRLPARDTSQIMAMVDKIILYEQNHLSPQSWMQDWLYVTDDPSDGDNFCQESIISGQHVHDSFNQMFLCLPTGATTTDVQNLRTQMFNTINNLGVTLLNYRGHGAIQSWAGAPASIMAVSDTGQWNNPLRPVIILSSDCLDGYFTYPGFQGLGETFVKLANKGTVAHWASTGLGYTFEHSVLTEGFYDALFIAGETAIGDSVNYAKIAYFNEGQHSSLLYTFVLQADPAMLLMRPELSLTKTAVQDEAMPGETVQFVMNVNNAGLYPGPVTVTDTLPAELDFVSVAADVAHTVTTQGNDVIIGLRAGNSPTHYGLGWGESATITLTAQVNGAASAGTVQNTAVVGGPGVEITAGNESDSASVEILPLPTDTPTPSPTATTSAIGSTGFRSPAAQQVTTGGDGNGFELNPTNALSNDGLYAVDSNSGTGTSTNCTGSGKDKHLFSQYSLTIPAGATITGIEVRLDALADSTAGAPKLCVQLSSNNGSSWTAAQSVALGTSEASYILGSPNDTWGRTWTSSNFSNASFTVRIATVSSDLTRDFSLDWVAVNVHYDTSPTATPTPSNTPTPSQTPTSTQTPTPSLTPTATPSTMGSTGFLSPAVQQVTGGGDGNGYELNPANALTNDGLYALDSDSGSGTGTNCTGSGKDKHLFRQYSLTIPAGTTITGIEVRLDAFADSTAGAPKLCVQLSSNNGSSWTTAQSATLGTAEATSILGSPTNTWGRSWTGSDFSNANFTVRVANVASDISRDFSLDWVAVNVYYDSSPSPTPSPTPTQTLTPTPTATPGGLLDSGLVSPQGDTAGSSGDGNGFQLNPVNAYSEDGLWAIDRDSGLNTSLACDDSGKDSHRFYGYSFELPANATISGIVVRLDARVDSTGASPKMCVELSWDGGVSWTAVQTTPVLGSSETTYLLGGPADSWGHAWSAAELNGGQLQVRITNVSSLLARDFSLEWLAVQVYYQ
jgi:uncharacterized repeat protein (TIGR01451 family)